MTVKVDTRPVSRLLTSIQRKQVPFAAATALNDVAFQTRTVELLQVRNTFAHPRPFTAKAVQVDKATKSKLTASVFIRPEVATYLAPYEFGGTHVVPGNAQLVPIHMRLDQYGQITKTTLAKLNAMADDPKSGVFFAEIHGVRGYWLRLKAARAAAPLMRRGKQVAGPVKPPQRLQLVAEIEAPMAVVHHLDFMKTGEHWARVAFPKAMERAMATALATARP